MCTLNMKVIGRPPYYKQLKTIIKIPPIGIVSSTVCYRINTSLASASSAPATKLETLGWPKRITNVLLIYSYLSSVHGYASLNTRNLFCISFILGL